MGINERRTYPRASGYEWEREGAASPLMAGSGAPVTLRCRTAALRVRVQSLMFRVHAPNDDCRLCQPPFRTGRCRCGIQGGLSVTVAHTPSPPIHHHDKQNDPARRSRG